MIRKLSITSPQAGAGSVRRFFKGSLKFAGPHSDRVEEEHCTKERQVSSASK